MKLSVWQLGKGTNWGKATGIAFSGMRSKRVRNMEDKVWPVILNSWPSSGIHSVNKEKRQPTLMDQSQGIGFNPNGNWGPAVSRTSGAALTVSHNDLKCSTGTSNMAQHLRNVRRAHKNALCRPKRHNPDSYDKCSLWNASQLSEKP